MVSQGICLQTWCFFLGVGCMWQKIKNSIFGDVYSCGGMNQYAFCWAEKKKKSCDSSWALQTHLQPARPLHLPSLKPGITTEEHPRIWLPHVNICAATQTPSQTQTFLHSACVNKVLPTHRPICLIPFAVSIDVLDFYRASNPVVRSKSWHCTFLQTTDTYSTVSAFWTQKYVSYLYF